jgi:hypothetical protein
VVIRVLLLVLERCDGGLAATFLVSAVRILILYPLRGTGKVLDGTDVALFGKRIKTL